MLRNIIVGLMLVFVSGCSINLLSNGTPVSSVQVLPTPTNATIPPAAEPVVEPTALPVVVEVTPEPAPSQPVTVSNVLQAGVEISGIIAEGAYDEYIFEAEANRPVLFNLKKVETGLLYGVDVFTMAGEKVTWFGAGSVTSTSGNPIPLPYTPKKTESLIIKVVGTGGYGTYVIKFEYLE